MTVVELRRASAMSQREFAEHYGIPVRTLQQWEQGKSSPPPYVVSMMEKLQPSKKTPDANRFYIPEKRQWKVCIDAPFENCERIYPIQQRKVRELLDDVVQTSAVKRVVIFGSSVTQRCHQGSDVDVYIEMSEDINPVQKYHDFPYDLWTNYTADNRLKAEIAKRGVVVYGA